MWEAAKKGDLPRLRGLLAAGVDPNAPFRLGGTALLFAAQHGHAEAARVLLEHGADINAAEELNGTTALIFAVGHPDVIRVLVEHGANVLARDLRQGQTVLWWTVDREDRESTEILLASGRFDARALREAFDHAQERGLPQLDKAIEP
ncbi:MAG TPA: ankyrin repeat domain-containing protein, partial [Thermoanaerobaculia bacterium]|nr:ankyrin repeat domain-containing protein [Thermoanaerobaculia bacterium]